MSNSLSLSTASTVSSGIENQDTVMLEPCKHVLLESDQKIIWNAYDFQMNSLRLCPTCLQPIRSCVTLKAGSQQLQEVAAKVQESAPLVLTKKSRPEPVFPGISALFICTRPWSPVDTNGGSLCRSMTLHSRTPGSFLYAINVCGYLKG